jgi:hypothetical protein
MEPDTMTTPRENAQAAIDAAGITITADFVPFSQSRNKADKMPSLNWIVHVLHKGREILATDYGQGYGHCPAYKNPSKFHDGKHDKYTTDQRIANECEKGRVTKEFGSIGIVSGQQKIPAPDVCDVLYSLCLDSDVLDSSGFEDWAANFGYDTDSRKSEAIYRACLDIALKLRAALGDSILANLRQSFQDY